MGRTIRKGTATVTVTGYEGIEERARHLEAVAAAAIVERLGVVRDGARERWPVDTGRSRDGLTLTSTSTGGRLTNPVEYAPFVRRAGDTRRAWDLYVRSKIVNARAATNALIGTILREYLEGQRGR